MRHSRPRMSIVVVAVLSFVASAVVASPCGTCNGNGVCNPSAKLCQCVTGYRGNQCEFKICPYGYAWADQATATDTAHAMAECSNMGLCDPTTGVCKCQAGFEGPACEVMSCPPCVNGRCLTMAEAAQAQDDYNFFTTTTYSLWDANKVRGCKCDYGWQGYDCSLRRCPVGDDPMTTGQALEVQQLSCLCNGCSGSIVLSYQGFYTTNLAPTMTASQLQTALNALLPIQGVAVTLSGGPGICSSSGTVSSITFINNGGNLPSLKVTNLLTGGTSSASVATTVDGTTESGVCSNQGLCNTANGVCACQPGAGSPGTVPDCGWGIKNTCPTVGGNVCNSQGTCTNAPLWQCSCNNGWTGVDCSLRSCPSGPAWFDGATAPNVAHANAVCSNKGNCNYATGTCTCQLGFSGAACNILNCPGVNGNCNGHGTCKTMQQLAAVATSNGNLLGVTYGLTPNNVPTWDATMIQGCFCSQHQYMGPYVSAVDDFMAYDCSARTCVPGSDPYQTGVVDEQQTISCTADGGTFTLSFRQFTTAPISASATAAQVQAALQALTTIRTATVTFSAGSTVCSASGVTTTVQFTYAQGPLPLMVATGTSLTFSGGSWMLSVAELVVGTKSNLECAGRGWCDRTTGVCKCYDGFVSSDGNGNVGIRGDCGSIAPFSSVTAAVG
ncbi:Aste57867_16194 [Aphanomyces stellatus]|uniref:Aste57867_16194 protein n=1 Tax=Aphanomyces stellatus TaxID=120398 RepID=A0A485L6R3_9STRA|nr:hypothetical protein As57867_016138 [Aphanomyces stellatus]VFT92972.1 Aste57867_16194 [Aphanomyces stellatus]